MISIELERGPAAWSLQAQQTEAPRRSTPRHRSAKVICDVPVLSDPPESFGGGINSFEPGKARHFPKVSPTDGIGTLALKSEHLAQKHTVQHSQKEQTDPLNLLQTALQEPLYSLNLRQP